MSRNIRNLFGLLGPRHAATNETLGHPSAGILGLDGGSANASGVPVTKDSALTFAAVWCATRVLSETLATLPCLLYERGTDDSRERAVDDPRFMLMHDEPHPMMSAMSFFESQTAQMVLCGNSYSRIRFDGSGEPRQLEPRSPDSVTIDVQDDNIVYKVDSDGIKETLPANEMLHVAGIGGDGISGWSVIQYAQQSIGSGMAGENYAAGIMGTGATPHGVIDHPGRLDKAAREQFRREWNEAHKGSDKAGNVAILHGGIKYQPVSMSNQDAQFLESREYSVREIARWFRLPPHMLADLADSSVRANIEQQAIEFVVYSLMPWLTRWQQALNRKLLTKDERKTMFFEFMTNALLKGDAGSRFQSYATGRQWGWLSINDIRKLENLNPVEGGDDYLQPTNMEVVGEEPPEPPPMMQQGFPPQQNDSEDDVAEELQANLSQSLNQIIESGQELRAQLATGQQQIKEALATADENSARRVAGLRADRAEIHRDLATLGSVAQVQGAPMLVDACNRLLHSHLECLLKLERSKVTQAVRKATKGKNFLEWLDTFYVEHSSAIAQKVADVASCYRALDDETPTNMEHLLATSICEAHKSDLLKAADGNRDMFDARVQFAMAEWEQQTTAITCEGIR